MLLSAFARGTQVVHVDNSVGGRVCRGVLLHDQNCRFIGSDPVEVFVFVFDIYLNRMGLDFHESTFTGIPRFR